MTSCAVTGVAAIADSRAAAPKSADFVIGVLLFGNKTARRVERSEPTRGLMFMAEPRAVSAVRLGKAHPSVRCFAMPAFNCECDVAESGKRKVLDVAEPSHTLWMRGRRLMF